MNVPFLQNTTFTGLISTDEYRTSYEWNEAYNISQNVFTNVQSNSGNWDTAYNTTTALQLSTNNWNSAYNIATFYSLNSAILIEQTTFSELTSYKANNQLKPGQLYQINDFRLLWWNNDSVNTLLSSNVIEPLIVQAIDNNKIRAEAYSTLHPEDIVYYDIDARTSKTWKAGPSDIPNFKGWIYRRVDQKRDIDIAWDWRYITNNCCLLDVASVSLYSTTTTYSKNSVVKTTGNKLYISVQNNNLNNSVINTAWWRALTVYTNDSTVYFPTLETGVGSSGSNYIERVASVAPLLSTRAPFYTFAANLSAPGQPQNLDDKPNIRNIKIESGLDGTVGNTVFNCRVNSSIGGVTIYNSLVVGSGCKNNLFSGSSVNLGGFNNCRIGSNFIGNIFVNQTNNCIFGDNVQYNSLLIGNLSNSIFSNNIQRNLFSVFGLGGGNSVGLFLGNDCLNNFFLGPNNINIGLSFQNNVTSNPFSNNTVGINCTNNFFNTAFQFNKIGDVFQNNTIGSNCTYNSFENGCTNNSVGTFMSYNKIGNLFTNNTIGNLFQNNTISNNFSINLIGNNFRRVNAGNSVTNKDFSLATHVYNDYDKNMNINVESIAIITYISGTTVVVTNAES